MNQKPNVSAGAVYKSSINSSVTGPAIPSVLSVLRAEVIVGKSPLEPTVYVPLKEDYPAGL